MTGYINIHAAISKLEVFLTILKIEVSYQIFRLNQTGGQHG